MKRTPPYPALAMMLDELEILSRGDDLAARNEQIVRCRYYRATVREIMERTGLSDERVRDLASRKK